MRIVRLWKGSCYNSWDRWEPNDAWLAESLPFYSPELTSPTSCFDHTVTTPTPDSTSQNKTVLPLFPLPSVTRKIQGPFVSVCTTCGENIAKDNGMDLDLDPRATYSKRFDVFFFFSLSLFFFFFTLWLQHHEDCRSYTASFLFLSTSSSVLESSWARTTTPSTSSC